VAGVTAPSRWIGALTAQRGPLRTYQWLWLLLCTLGALVVAAPRILLQPVVYVTDTVTHFDTTRYGGIYNPVALDRTGLDIAIADATEALRQRLLARRELRFGLPNYRVEFIPQAPGEVTVHGVAPIATEAQQLAGLAADELVRQIRAAGGREVLRNLLGWELVVALRGEPATTRFQRDLRVIIERDAFPLSRRIEPVSERISVESLPAEEQNDLTRALESRYDQWTFALNLHNTALDQACGTASIIATAEREAALRRCATTDPAVAQELQMRDRAVLQRQAIGSALEYLRDTLGQQFTPNAAGSVQSAPAVLPSAPVDRRVGLLLALAALVGLVFGGVGVAVDRSAGVMRKLLELWSYRELMRNLVLRDLRARYKGSTLGYLWTQLAPLLMMLLFWFVFSSLFSSGIAMFPVFLIVGLLAWNYCAEAVSGGARSVIDNANLIKKVFFPREVLPLVTVLSSLVNYLLSLPMMFLVIAVVQLLYAPLHAQEQWLNFSWTFAYLPVLLVIQTLFLSGVALFLGALAVSFRDTVHLIGILIQFWFFLTPVIYALDLLNLNPSVVQAIRWLNPMAPLVEFYREILYGTAVPVGQVPTPGLPALDSVLRVLVTALLVLAAGYWFFQRRSRSFGEDI
jgi:lipopolysaccharide transport system permease protein